MTILQNITTKPNLNEYMEKVFNYHLYRLNNKDNMEKVKEGFRNVIKKDLELRKEKRLKESNYKDIFNLADLSKYEKQKNDIDRFDDKDNKFYKAVMNDINEDINHLVNNRDVNIIEAYEEFNFNYLFHENIGFREANIAKTLNRMGFVLDLDSYAIRDSKISIKFDSTNLIIFNINYSEIYGAEKIKKFKYDFKNGNLRNTTFSLSDTLTSLLELDHLLYSISNNYELNIENIIHNMESESKNILTEINSLINSIIEYQRTVKNKDLKSNDIIDKIISNTSIRKLQLDFETNNEELYEIKPIPKHLKKFS